MNTLVIKAEVDLKAVFLQPKCRFIRAHLATTAAVLVSPLWIEQSE